MDKLSILYLKIGYWLGVSYGLVIFSFNSTTKRFQPSKNIKIYHNYLVLLGAVCIFGILHFYQTVLSFDNMVIQIATPLNFFALISIVINSVYGARLREREHLKILNEALDISEVDEKNGAKFNFPFKLFIRTIAFDALYVMSLNIMLVRNISDYGLELIPYIVYVVQSGKGIVRFYTHFYICAINYNIQLLNNVKSSMKRSIEEFDNFLKFNPGLSKHQLILKCCQLSDNLDGNVIQVGRILNLTKRTIGVFEFHILQLILHNMTDVLAMVRIYLKIYETFNKLEIAGTFYSAKRQWLNKIFGG